MQGQPGPEASGRGEVAPVFHDAPVRIPFATPAPARRRPADVVPSVVLGLAALAWIGAAADHPGPGTLAAAGAFGLASAADLAVRALGR